MSDNEGLERTLDEAEWEWLKPHAERDAVVLVARHLDLLHVGRQMAANDARLIQSWVDQGLIAKPTKEQLAQWAKEPNKRFITLIVQPYVLAQEIIIQ